jgi:hypothetical protein
MLGINLHIWDAVEAEATDPAQNMKMQHQDEEEQEER